MILCYSEFRAYALIQKNQRDYTFILQAMKLTLKGGIMLQLYCGNHVTERKIKRYFNNATV